MEREQGIKMMATSNGWRSWRMQLPASCAPASSQGAMKIISKRLLTLAQGYTDVEGVNPVSAILAGWSPIAMLNI
jgi:hypothetical protein